MIVARDNLAKVLSDLSGVSPLAADTETTGLSPYGGDYPFSLAIASAVETYYFNFNEYPDLDPNLKLTPTDVAPLFEDRRNWLFHNAKFDIAMLENVGLDVKGDIFDCKVMGRIIHNDAGYSYSLDELAAKAGLGRKDTTVWDYIVKKKLFTERVKPGKQAKEKVPQFARVPLDLMSRYAQRDVRLTFDLADRQLAEIEKITEMYQPTWPNFAKFFEGERLLLPCVRRMEKRGVLVDKPFCYEAIDHEMSRIVTARDEFKRITGHEYKASGKLFAEIFKDENLKYTEKNNPTFEGDILESFQHPAARLIVDMRDAKARADTYQGFLYHSEHDGAIHSDFDQAGTATGRFSSSSPNLQNLKKESATEGRYVVRRAIVPRPGYVFAMFDMDQAEYRLALDYAGAKALIAKVLEGLDVHEATAQLAGILRQAAKTVNFAILYGAGVALLAERLGITRGAARALIDAVFGAAPELERLINTVKNASEKRGYVFNWAGRLLRCSDPKFSYKMTNHLIQGGVGDIVKQAMVKTTYLLDDASEHGSGLVLNVHDELVYEIHERELWLASELHRVLQGIYPHRYIPLTWGADYSRVSLADKIEGFAA